MNHALRCSHCHAPFVPNPPGAWRPAALQGRAARGRRAGGWGAAAAHGEKGLWNAYPHDMFCTNHEIGRIPKHLVRNSIELFGKEVIPAFR